MAKAKERRERRVERGRRMTLFLSLSGDMQMSQKGKGRQEKLKWTPTRVCTAERYGISTDKRSTTFAINSTAIGLEGNFQERHLLLIKKRKKTENFPLTAKIFIIFASTVNSRNGKEEV